MSVGWWRLSTKSAGVGKKRLRLTGLLLPGLLAHWPSRLKALAVNETSHLSNLGLYASLIGLNRHQLNMLQGMNFHTTDTTKSTASLGRYDSARQEQHDKNNNSTIWLQTGWDRYGDSSPLDRGPFAVTLDTRSFNEKTSSEAMPTGRSHHKWTCANCLLQTQYTTSTSSSTPITVNVYIAM